MFARLLGYCRDVFPYQRLPGGKVPVGPVHSLPFPQRLSAQDTNDLSTPVGYWMDAAYLTFWDGNQLYNVGYYQPPFSWIIAGSGMNDGGAQRSAQAVAPPMSVARTAGYLERIRSAWQINGQGPNPSPSPNMRA